MNYQEIIKRLKKSLYITSDADLAKLLGKTRQGFHNEKKRETIDYEKIINLCQLKEISLEFIFYGQESNTQQIINQLQKELEIEKRLVSEIKSMMKEIVGKA